jgi:hypothetical protein
LQGRLASFQRSVTESVVADENQDVEIKFTRTLTPDQLPKVLKALLFVTGATPKNLTLKYAFGQGINWEMKGIFSVKWDDRVENDGKTQKDQFKDWPRDIESIVVYVSEGKDWEVEFDTNDKGDYSVELDENDRSLLKYESPQLLARLEASNKILTDQDYRVRLQEELVSLLDPNDPCATLDIRDIRTVEIERMVRGLIAGARKILGKE